MCAVRATPKLAAVEAPSLIPAADNGGRPEIADRGGSLAKRIRDRRYAIGWGPDDLATRAKISRTALYHIESGQTRHPRAQTLMGIADALGIDISELTGGDEVAVVGVRGAESGRNMREREASAGDRARHAENDLRRKFEDLLVSPVGPAFVRFLEMTHGLISAVGDCTTTPGSPTAGRRVT